MPLQEAFLPPPRRLAAQSLPEPCLKLSSGSIPSQCLVMSRRVLPGSGMLGYLFTGFPWSPDLPVRPQGAGHVPVCSLLTPLCRDPSEASVEPAMSPSPLPARSVPVTPLSPLLLERSHLRVLALAVPSPQDAFPSHFSLAPALTSCRSRGPASWNNNLCPPAPLSVCLPLLPSAPRRPSPGDIRHLSSREGRAGLLTCVSQ